MLSTGPIQFFDPKEIPNMILKDPFPEFLIAINALRHFITTIASRSSTEASRISTVVRHITAEESGVQPL
ncbi:hypothetical protein AUM41_17670 [Cronobacter malonaticus]|nr:hypothetical protein [Cronobacter malonaticus]EGT4456055.1 hypothetical protein [Cronobacter malonaticus]PUX22436.1 hypothetical protein BS413_06400 [Cronobacter malonaticus]